MIKEAAPVLAADSATVTTDRMGRLYAVIPDDVARPLALAARQGIDPEAHGIFFESDPHPARSWTATTVRTIFEAVLSSPVAAQDHDAWGLRLYRKYGGCTLLGFIVGESGRDTGTRRWRDFDTTDDLRVRGCASIVAASRPALAGTCTF
ncbi:hypothetical protein [Streptomyces sp. NPDC005548]|uniref:hypothetical protein n=1 Tax=Streptomyces sp. NPDC005548 TaxID=3364724 RepID=UPI0036C99A40